MPKPVGDVIAERIRRFRKAKEMTIVQLAEACAAQGAPGLTPASLTNLERPASGVRGRRQVAVEELLTLAYVLQVPPLSIVLPIGEDVEVELVPGAPAVDVAQALTWLSGDSSHGLDGKNPPDLSAWFALGRLKEHSRLVTNAADGYYRNAPDARGWYEMLQDLRRRLHDLGETPPPLPGDLRFLEGSAGE